MPKTQPAKEKPERPQPQRRSTILVEADPNNPQTHVQVVQFAIDNAPEDGGSTVLLKGTFEFGTAQVIVKGWADISGYGHPQKRAIIHAGGSPFLVQSGSYPVRITGVEFREPSLCAIEIKSCTGLTIRDCVIKEVQVVPAPNQPFNTGGAIFGHSTTMGVVTNIFGNLEISNNQIDVDGTAYSGLTETTDRTFGIMVDLNGNGVQATPPTVHVAQNTVANVTAHGIALRNLGNLEGRIENNQITTGVVGGRSTVQSFVDGILCQGSGKYVVANNNPIDSGYKNSAGVRLLSTSGAVVENNVITMSSPTASDSEKDTESAAIEVRRNPDSTQAQNNKVQDNLPISGQARAVISVVVDPTSPSTPRGNAFSRNNHSGFGSSLADIFIDAGVKQTTITDGSGGSIRDNSTPGETTILPPNYQPV